MATSDSAMDMNEAGSVVSGEYTALQTSADNENGAVGGYLLEVANPSMQSTYSNSVRK